MSSPENAPREKNSASALDISTILYSNSMKVKQFLLECGDKADHEKLASRYVGFYVALAKATARPTRSVVKSGVLQYDSNINDDEATKFADVVKATFTHCRDRARWSSTGVRTDSAVLAIGKLVYVPVKTLPIKTASPKAVSPVKSLPRAASPTKMWKGVAHLLPPKGVANKLQFDKQPQSENSIDAILENYGAKGKDAKALQ